MPTFEGIDTLRNALDWWARNYRNDLRSVWLKRSGQVMFELIDATGSGGFHTVHSSRFDKQRETTMPDDEIAAIQTAYSALKGMDRKDWTRALDYIGKRLAGDDRGRFLSLHGLDLPEPTQYVLAGDLNTAAGDSSDVVDELESWGIAEVNGVAIVSQRFAVMVPLGNADGDIDGHEIEWFDTRDAAEAYVAEALSTETRPERQADAGPF